MPCVPGEFAVECRRDSAHACSDCVLWSRPSSGAAQDPEMGGKGRKASMMAHIRKWKPQRRRLRPSRRHLPQGALPLHLFPPFPRVAPLTRFVWARFPSSLCGAIPSVNAGAPLSRPHAGRGRVQSERPPPKRAQSRGHQPRHAIWHIARIGRFPLRRSDM